MFPIATIPQWIAGCLFYDLLNRVVTCIEQSAAACARIDAFLQRQSS